MKKKHTARYIERHKNFYCIDCKKDTWYEYYTVNNRLWKKINPKISGMLCIGCVETRLGRKLKKADFADKPINTKKFTRTPRLINRLQREV